MGTNYLPKNMFSITSCYITSRSVISQRLAKTPRRRLIVQTFLLWTRKCDQQVHQHRVKCLGRRTKVRSPSSLRLKATTNTLEISDPSSWDWFPLNVRVGQSGAKFPLRVFQVSESGKSLWRRAWTQSGRIIPSGDFAGEKERQENRTDGRTRRTNISRMKEKTQLCNQCSTGIWSLIAA